MIVLARRCTALLAAVVLVATSSGASEREDAIAYEAPAACASADAFAARVGERTGRATKVAPGAPIRVKITRDASAFHGTLTVVDDAGPHVRAFDGATCAEVVDALALVTAISLEEAPASAASAAASASTELPPAEPPPVEPAPVASAKPAPIVDRAPAATPPASRAPTTRWALGAAFDVVTLGGPPVPFAMSAYAEWSRATASALSPSLRLSIARIATHRDVDAIAGTSLALTWTFGELDACALRVTAGRAWEIDACALAMAGVLAATPSGLEDSSTHLRPWLAAGGTLRVRLSLGAGVYVESRSGVTAPITRDRFLVDEPPIVAYSAPSVTVFAGLGAGVRFP